jgi:hypothetical protein
MCIEPIGHHIFYRIARKVVFVKEGANCQERCADQSLTIHNTCLYDFPDHNSDTLPHHGLHFITDSTITDLCTGAMVGASKNVLPARIPVGGCHIIEIASVV